MKKLIYIVTVFVAGFVAVASALGAVLVVVFTIVTKSDTITNALLFVGFLGVGGLAFALLDGMTPELFGVEKPVKSRRKKISRRA